MADAFPVAVSPGTLTPGIYVTVDLTASPSAPGVGVLRVLIQAPKTGSGTLTPDGAVETGAGEASAVAAFGARSPGYWMAKHIYDQDPTAQIDFQAVTPGAGTATLDITASGVPSADNAVDFDIAGRLVQVPWYAGESADTLKTRAVANINASYLGRLPVVTSSGGTGVVTVDFAVTGSIGNDCKVRARLVLAQTGTEAIDTNTFTNLAGGTTAPDLTTALSVVQGREYHYMIAALANAEVQSGTGSNNPTRIKTHINNLNTGLGAKLQQAIFGSTGSIANSKTGAIARNLRPSEHILAVNAHSLPYELAAREAGGRLAAIKVDPAANRIGEVLTGIFGSDDVVADTPTIAESEDALGNGVALCSYNTSGEVIVMRPITTYSQDSAGGPDRRLLDVQNVDASYIVIRDLVSFVAQEYPGAKVSKDIAPGEEPPPEGVVEERDIRSSVVERLRFWARRGVIQRQALEDAVVDGTLAVRVNPSDSTQVDMVIPHKVVQPLAKVGIVGQRLAG